MKTKWLGLWEQEKNGMYAGQVLKKKDIPTYTRIVLMKNKFYEKGGNRPRFVYCFTDSDGYEKMIAPVEEEQTVKMYTKDEVYRIIHGIETEYGLTYGNNLIEDYL